MAQQTIGQYLPKDPQQEYLHIREKDYQGENGLWICGTCGKPKQRRIDNDIIGVHKTVWCLCDCESKKLKEAQEKEEKEQEVFRIRRLKSASMMAGKYQNADFEHYDLRDENKKAYWIAKKYVAGFKQMITIGLSSTGEKNAGLLFYGPVGTGKSYTAACIANYLLNHDVSVIMTSFVRILEDIKGVSDESGYIDSLNACSLLIIDDLGAERNTDYALEKVYNIVDSRVRIDKPMVLTTNLSFDDMMQTTDIRYRRIYDRVFEHCIPIEIAGKSFRIQKAAERQKRLSTYFDGGE